MGSLWCSRLPYISTNSNLTRPCRFSTRLLKRIGAVNWPSSTGVWPPGIPGRWVPREKIWSRYIKEDRYCNTRLLVIWRSVMQGKKTNRLRRNGFIRSPKERLFQRRLKSWPGNWSREGDQNCFFIISIPHPAHGTGLYLPEIFVTGHSPGLIGRIINFAER